MSQKIPINKGNYSMDTEERLKLFEKNRGLKWEKEYSDYRRNWTDFAQKKYISDYPLLVDLELASICNLKCPGLKLKEIDKVIKIINKFI